MGLLSNFYQTSLNRSLCMHCTLASVAFLALSTVLPDPVSYKIIITQGMLGWDEFTNLAVSVKSKAVCAAAILMMFSVLSEVVTKIRPLSQLLMTGSSAIMLYPLMYPILFVTVELNAIQATAYVSAALLFWSFGSGLMASIISERVFYSRESTMRNSFPRCDHEENAVL